MAVFPDPLPAPEPGAPGESIPDPFAEVGQHAPTHPPETARDGSPAARPGDPAPAPRDDGAPIFSTDPLDR